MRTCTACGAKNPDRAEYCSQCVKPLFAPARAASTSGQSRPSTDANGARRSAASTSGQRRTSTNASPSREPAAARKRCPNCGAVMPANAVKCPRCGYAPRGKKSVDPKLLLVAGLALILVVGVTLAITHGAKPRTSSDEARSTAAATPPPAVVEASREAPSVADNAARTGGTAFEALALSQDDEAVTVYDAVGNGKRVSPEDASAYLSGLICAAIAQTPAPGIEIYHGEDYGWGIALTYAPDAAALSKLLAMTDDEIYRRASNEIIGKAQAVMQTYVGSRASIAVNWMSEVVGAYGVEDEDTVGTALRVTVPANPIEDALGDDPEHPQVFRYTETGFDDQGENDTWDNLDDWEVDDTWLEDSGYVPNEDMPWVGTWGYEMTAVSFDGFENSKYVHEENMDQQTVIITEDDIVLYDGHPGTTYGVRQAGDGVYEIYWVDGSGQEVDTPYYYMADDDALNDTLIMVYPAGHRFIQMLAIFTPELADASLMYIYTRVAD